MVSKVLYFWPTGTSKDVWQSLKHSFQLHCFVASKCNISPKMELFWQVIELCLANSNQIQQIITCILCEFLIFKTSEYYGHCDELWHGKTNFWSLSQLLVYIVEWYVWYCLWIVMVVYPALCILYIHSITKHENRRQFGICGSFSGLKLIINLCLLANYVEKVVKIVQFKRILYKINKSF